MAELTHYRCPNCGASITNTENCEYCGSLLVRFTKRGIDLSKTSYLSNDKVIPGLIDNLRQNLNLQRANPNEQVQTLICWAEHGLDDQRLNFVQVQGLNVPLLWKDGQEMFPGKQAAGLCIVIDCSTWVGDSEIIKENNKIVDELFQRYQQLDSFPLFMSHQCYYTDEWGWKRKVRELAINFGVDAEGAARLISEIIEKVELVPANEKIDIFTNQGVEAIDRAFINANKEIGVDTSELEKNLENRRNEGCYVATAIYGSYDCPSVWTLRRYRDYTLDKTFAGRAFIKTYYAISPTLVRWFGNTKWFKAMWKPVLDRMVSKLQKKGVESTPYKDKY